MGVHSGIVPFHAPAALGARYTRFVALLVNGRAMREVGVSALVAVIVIGEDMATLEIRVTIALKKFKIAVPLREVDNKI